MDATYAYQTIRATSYEEIAEQANELGRQGWRLLPPVYQAFDAGTQQRVLLAVVEKCERVGAAERTIVSRPAEADFRSPVPLGSDETLEYLTRTSVGNR